jgi:hypothetical protein
MTEPFTLSQTGFGCADVQASMELTHHKLPVVQTALPHAHCAPLTEVPSSFAQRFNRQMHLSLLVQPYMAS